MWILKPLLQEIPSIYILEIDAMNLQRHINEIYRHLIKVPLEYRYTSHLYIHGETGFTNIYQYRRLGCMESPNSPYVQPGLAINLTSFLFFSPSNE
jgi:hypothetical protein